jgi:hypothetical protein
MPIVDDPVFWTFFMTTVVGCILKFSSMFYKSKCKEVTCCCIKIVRDTELEEKEHEYDVEHNVNDNNNNVSQNRFN